MKENNWSITKVNKADDGTVVSIYAEDEYENKVSFKWDGCIDLHHDDNYIHICDIDNMIEKLQEIKQIAKKEFNKQNYKEYWSK
ncbi:hypothetical protein AAHH67_15525 [Niallia circulans]